MKTLEKIIKEASAANKIKSGTKQVFQSVKGSKLIILSRSVELKYRIKIQEQAKLADVFVYEFDGNSVQLGKLSNKPFRVSVLSLKEVGDLEINSLFPNKPNG